MRKCFVSFALALAMLYLTLSVSAVACLFAHEGQPHSAHHHTGGVTHFSLCAWACHANPTFDLSAATPQTQPLHLVSMLPLIDSSVPPFLSQQSAQSRAPPRS
jgi:mannose/fructose/N-acetylgalactosamine-specific phosphotransferase system component IIC